jgi:hypothetical protein
MKKIKVYGEGNWIDNSIPSSFKEADIVVMPGGADICTALYGHKPIKGADYNKSSDDSQMDLINKSIESGKLLFGTCRGAQLLTARAGGWLIQDINHPSNHIVTTIDGNKFSINSCHHQMCYLYDLPKEDYELFAWAEQLSNRHTIQGDIELKFSDETLDKNGKFKEPEIFYYPKINALCAQNHFEWKGNSNQARDFINNLITEKLKIKL